MSPDGYSMSMAFHLGFAHAGLPWVSVLHEARQEATEHRARRERQLAQN